MRFWLSLVLMAWIVACGSHESHSWQDIPAPYGLAEVDVAVREQYDELQAALAQAKQANDTAQLAEAAGRLGMWHQNYRYPESALAYYQRAEELAPNDYRWPYYSGHLYRNNGRLAAARAAFQRALTIRPKDVPAAILLAEVLEDLGDNARAQGLYEQVLTADPDQPRALLGLGTLFLSRGEYEAAVAHLKRGLSLQPDANRIRYALGRAYQALGERERARSLLTRDTVGLDNEVPLAMDDPAMVALGQMRRSGRNLVAQAQAALRAGKQDQAVVLFQKAVETAPDKAGIRLQWADALLLTGQQQAALEVLEAGVRQFPRHAPTWNKLAMTLARNGAMDRAEKAFLQALAIDDGYEEAHFNLAMLYQMTSRDDQALPHLARCIAINPGEPRHRIQRAMILWQAGRYAEAISATDADRAALPGKLAPAILYARFLALAPGALADAERAFSLAEAGFAKKPCLGWLETLAMASAARGDFQQALSYQTRARAALPSTRAGWIQQRGGRYAQQSVPQQPWFPAERAELAVPIKP